MQTANSKQLLRRSGSRERSATKIGLRSRRVPAGELQPKGSGSTPAYSWYLHQRDAGGNTKPRVWHHEQALVDDQTTSSTQLADVLEVIATQLPGEASRLAHSFDHEIQESRRSYLETIREEAARLEATNEAIAQHNADIDQKTKECDRDYSETAGKLAATLGEVRSELLQREVNASELLGQGGASFNPDDLSDETALLSIRPSEEAAAHACHLPPGDVGISPIHPVIWHGVSVTVGSALGVGLAVTSHMLYADQLASHWPVTVGAAVCGTGVAIAAKAAVSRAGALVGAFHFSERIMEARVAGILLGGVTVALLAIDAGVLQTGLLASLDADALTASALSHSTVQAQTGGLAFTLVGLSVSGGYLLAACYDGFLSGMKAAVQQTAIAYAEGRELASEMARRADPLVKRSLGALGKVRVLRAHQATLEAELAAATEQHQTEEANLETRRLPLLDRPDETGILRVQEAREGFLGVLMDFRQELRAALVAVETPSRRWASVRRSNKPGWLVRMFRWMAGRSKAKRSNAQH